MNSSENGFEDVTPIVIAPVPEGSMTQGKFRSGIQINILLCNISRQYIDIANINIDFHLAAISIY